VKQDEIDLAKALLSHPGYPSVHRQPGERPFVCPSMARGDMHEKRCESISEKWEDRGWLDGVGNRGELSGLTDKGRAEMPAAIIEAERILARGQLRDAVDALTKTPAGKALLYNLPAVLQALHEDVAQAHADGLNATCLRADFDATNTLVRDTVVPAIDALVAAEDA